LLCMCVCEEEGGCLWWAVFSSVWSPFVLFVCVLLSFFSFRASSLFLPRPGSLNYTHSLTQVQFIIAKIPKQNGGFLSVRILLANVIFTLTPPPPSVHPHPYPHKNQTKPNQTNSTKSQPPTHAALPLPLPLPHRRRQRQRRRKRPPPPLPSRLGGAITPTIVLGGIANEHGGGGE
jgi:hypothetical protein